MGRNRLKDGKTTNSLLCCKFSLDNALEVESERLLESLRIGVLHGGVVAVHVVAREAALLPTHLREKCKKIRMRIILLSKPGPCSFEAGGRNRKEIGWMEPLVPIDRYWSDRDQQRWW